MKKTALLLLLTFCTLCGAHAGETYNVTVNNVYYKLYHNYTTQKLTYASVARKPDNGKYSGTVNIAEKVTYNGVTYPVTEIGYSAFGGTQYDITAITIPNTVTKIDINAFYNCRGLKQLTIPASVTEIGEAAFSNCTFEALTLECTLASYNKVFDGLNTSSVVYCKESEINRIKMYFKGTVYKIGTVVVVPVDEMVQDGLAFALNHKTKTATVTGRDPETKNLATTPQQLTIPETVAANDMTYDVTSIDERAFSYDQELATISMPSSVTKMGSYTFYNCRHLLSVELSSRMYTIPQGAFNGCGSLKNVTIPKGVSKIEADAFSYCTMLAYDDSLFIPSSMTNIAETAFYGCTGMIGFHVEAGNSSYSSRDGVLYKGRYNELLKCPPRCGKGDIRVPETCRTIGKEAFKDCADITSITMGNLTTTIKTGAFWGCTAMKTIRLSPMLESLGGVAFADCKSLRAVTLPRTLTNLEVTGDLFNGCKLRQLVVLCPVNKDKGFQTAAFNADWMAQGATVFTYEKEAFQQAAPSVSVVQIPQEGVLSDVTLYFHGADFTVPGQMGIAVLSGVKVGDNDVTSYNTIGNCEARGLMHLTGYQVVATYTPYFTGIEYEDYLGVFQTPQLNIRITSTTPTQTTISGTVEVDTDKTFQPEEIGVCPYYSYNTDNTPATNGHFKMTGLKPNESYNIVPYAKDGDNYYKGIYTTVKTLGAKPTVTIIKAGPTSIEVRGSYTAGDAKVTRAGFNDEGAKTIIRTGLDPNTKYTFTFTVEFATGGKETGSQSFTTTALQLKTLAPKVVNQGEAIVAAETNICDEETGAGFEWRKTDAPALVESKTAGAVVYDGTMEGIIKNMTVGAYYKVRPYYRSSYGQTYYGDWTGIDPGEFSYFEPTVHTYATVDVEGNTATLKGYVLQGSDDIKEQGFEYWLKTAFNTRAAGTNVTRVAATGQRMTVVLRNLQSNATYAYRAYVTTSRGTTYGEEYVFTVPRVDTAVDGVATVEPQHFDVYNMRGVRVRHQATTLDGLPAGLYIVNGRKRLVK